LSYIALRQPVVQSHVVKVRGTLAYGHVKQLRDMGLISEEKLGRSKVLRTTASFSDYFNLSQDTRMMKNQIQKIFEEIKPAQPTAAQKSEAQEIPSASTQEQPNVVKASDPSATGQ